MYHKHNEIGEAGQFTNPWDCDRCANLQHLCDLHQKMQAEKKDEPQFDPTCRYCVRRGTPCVRHSAPLTKFVIPQELLEAEDSELGVMQKIVSLLDPCEIGSRERILIYVNSRFK